ncbi:MAG: MerC domain-containing protein [Pseudomonadota bacterium]
MQTARIDVTAISVSGLCIIHCLALPVLVSTLPILGPVAEAEWLHRALVLLVLPVSALAFVRATPGSQRMTFGAMAIIGVGLLLAGAFVEPFHDYETVLTVAGAIILSAAHGFRWWHHRRATSVTFRHEDRL